MNRISRTRCLIAVALVVVADYANSQEDALTLREAVAHALEHHPALEAYTFGIRAAEARREQAGLRPNPELELEVEEIRFGNGGRTETVEFDGTNTVTGVESADGSDPGLDNAEVTLALTQVIEMGRKRSRRIAAGEQEVTAITWEYEAARLEAATGAALQFVKTLGAQRRLALSEESLALLTSVYETIAARVQAGAASPIESSRARLETANAQLDVEDLREALQSARVELARVMGLETPAFGELAGYLDAFPETPAWEAVERASEGNPDLLRWHTEIARRESLLALERSNRWPDLTVRAGWRSIPISESDARLFDGGGAFAGRRWSRPDDDREHSFLLGLSVPLPLFNRNQGNIREAEHLVSKATSETRAAHLDVRAALRSAWLGLSAKEARALRLRDEVVPEAERIFDSTRDGYREGKFDYLAVLDAQRSLIESRERLTDAAIEVQLAWLTVERLTGSITETGAGRLDEE